MTNNGLDLPPISASEVETAYQILLGRRPENPEIITSWRARATDLQDLTRKIFASPECQLRFQALAGGGRNPPLTATEVDLLCRWAASAPSLPDCITNFLGVHTRVRFMPGLAGAGGMIEPLPIPSNFHGDLYEWLGTLWAVSEARGRMVVVELGAGWGPWLVSSAVAAGRAGVRSVDLVGVEGDAGKLEFMRQHFLDNGIDPQGHRLVLGIVAVEDGVARFPVLDDPAGDWGAASLDGAAAETGRRDGAGLQHSRIVELPAWSLATLLRPLDRIDLIHCDIQGDETRVLSAAAAILDKKVRRLVIGTHGRDIELELMERFTKAGWVLEYDKACRLYQGEQRMVLMVDGVQVWANPRLKR